MRRYATLKEPLTDSSGKTVYKIMLCEADEGLYLFEYDRPDAILGCGDRLYESLEDLLEDWSGLIDERGWIEMDDPLTDCQQDAFLPVRVKGRDVGKPEWGKYEILIDGVWWDLPIWD